MLFLANIEESSSKEWWCSSNRKEESGSSPAKEPVAEGLRRIQSSTSKFRRKRDGVVIRDSGPNVLDALTKQLGSLNYDEGVNYSDSECGGTLGRKFKTRSLDKTDSWASSSIDAENRLAKIS